MVVREMTPILKQYKNQEECAECGTPLSKIQKILQVMDALYNTLWETTEDTQWVKTEELLAKTLSIKNETTTKFNTDVDENDCADIAQ